jgi:LysR family transcriptional regulator, glycine cleavage system transcriptional activator
MRRLPPLHSLRAFEAAARHLHFGRAAEELHLDPTAISHQIRKLEELLGAQLFHRRPRPLRLTEAGAKLYPEICGAMDRMAAAVASARRDDPGPVIVSMTMGFAAEWFTPRLARLKARTGLDIIVHADNRSVDLSRENIDLAIRSREQAGAEGVWKHLFDDRLIAVAAPELFERSGRPANPKDVLGLPLIQYRWRSPDRAALNWKRWFESAGIEPRNLIIEASFTEESHAIQAAVSGLGVALLSESLIADRIGRGELAKLGEHHLTMPAFWAVYRQGHQCRADLDRLIEHLSD